MNRTVGNAGRPIVGQELWAMAKDVVGLKVTYECYKDPRFGTLWCIGDAAASAALESSICSAQDFSLLLAALMQLRRYKLIAAPRYLNTVIPDSAVAIRMDLPLKLLRQPIDSSLVDVVIEETLCNVSLEALACLVVANEFTLFKRVEGKRLPVLPAEKSNNLQFYRSLVGLATGELKSYLEKKVRRFVGRRASS
jgi:hypothetical protein